MFWMRVKRFYMNDLRYFKQPLHHDPSAFCRVILGGKCAQAGIERDQSGLVENTVPSDIRKGRKFKPEFLVEWNTPKKIYVGRSTTVHNLLF